MSVVEVEIFIEADIEKCFDAARNIDIHTQTVWKHTREEAVAGIRKGLIGFGDTVTFRATHFGVRQGLTAKITEFNRPYLFVDEMQKGAFRYLKHTHLFYEQKNGTLMKDILEFYSPLGFIGRAFDYLVLRHYMKKFLTDRNSSLKKLIEGNDHPSSNRL